MKSYLVILFIFLASPFAHSMQKNRCELNNSIYKRYLSMDFKSFDQSPPNGGWRGFANKGCWIEAAILIDYYRSEHLVKLLDWQKQILTWHSGQMYAWGGIKTLALARFNNSYDKNEEPNAELKWNAYVAASVAFLEGDLKKLKSEREKIAVSKDRYNLRNLDIVDGFIKCFGSTYAQAMAGECKL